MKVEDYRFYRRANCPHRGCGGTGTPHSYKNRVIKDLYEPTRVLVPVFRCHRCLKLFNLQYPALPYFHGKHASPRLIALCAHWRQVGMKIPEIVNRLREEFQCELSPSTVHDYANIEVECRVA